MIKLTVNLRAKWFKRKTLPYKNLHKFNITYQKFLSKLMITKQN